MSDGCNFPSASICAVGIMASSISSQRLSGAEAPTISLDDIDAANTVFLNDHPHVTGRVLCLHRVAAAFGALKAFITRNTPDLQPDAETRILHYEELLHREMVCYWPNPSVVRSNGSRHSSNITKTRSDFPTSTRIVC